MRTGERVAAERIPYGRPVRAEGDRCAVSVLLTDMIGIARRGGSGRDAWEAGELVIFQTDGGIRTDLAADAELTIAGVPRRLVAFEPHYFELREGKIVG